MGSMCPHGLRPKTRSDGICRPLDALSEPTQRCLASYQPLLVGSLRCLCAASPDIQRRETNGPMRRHGAKLEDPHVRIWLASDIAPDGEQSRLKAPLSASTHIVTSCGEVFELAQKVIVPE